MISQALNAFFLWREITFQYFCSSITTAGAKTISIWLVLWLEGTNPPGGETRNPQLRQDYRIIPSMSQNCLKFWDKFETKLRTDLRPYRDNLETYLTILLLRANWDIFETWVHSVGMCSKCHGYQGNHGHLKALFNVFTTTTKMSCMSLHAISVFDSV